MEMLREAEAWVGIGLLLFFALMVVLKVPGAAVKALDARAAKIQAALDEAERLRDDARALLDSLKLRREEIEVQAARMLADAEAEAKRMETEATARLEEQIVRRTQLADRRIATAEAQATADVKAAAGELAANLAEAVLARRIAGAKKDPLIDNAIAQIAERLQ